MYTYKVVRVRDLYFKELEGYLNMLAQQYNGRIIHVDQSLREHVIIIETLTEAKREAEAGAQTRSQPNETLPPRELNFL